MILSGIPKTEMEDLMVEISPLDTKDVTSEQLEIWIVVSNYWISFTTLEEYVYT